MAVSMLAVVIVTGEPIPSDERFEEPGYEDFMGLDDAFMEQDGFDQDVFDAQDEFFDFELPDGHPDKR